MNFISVITVTYNSGSELINTIESVLCQEFQNYEIIVKDAGSTDGSIQMLPQDDRIVVVTTPDKGIYDAMNQAMQYVHGDYTIFLNSGDYLYDRKVLSNIDRIINDSNKKNDIIYGDAYLRNRNGFIRYANGLSTYSLMTRSICHQAMFFSKRIIENCKYDYASFKYAADMEFYVNAIINQRATISHVDIVVVNYEGGGTSEIYMHKRIILREKKKIMNRYLSNRDCFLIELRKLVTLRTFKELIGSSKFTIKIYEKLAIKLIHKK